MDERGSIEKAQVISALQSSGDADYDTVSVYSARVFRDSIDVDWQARETLKSVNIDSSGRVEMEDWVQLHSLLRASKAQPL